MQLIIIIISLHNYIIALFCVLYIILIRVLTIPLAVKGNPVSPHAYIFEFPSETFTSTRHHTPTLVSNQTMVQFSGSESNQIEKPKIYMPCDLSGSKVTAALSFFLRVLDRYYGFLSTEPLSRSSFTACGIEANALLESSST